MDFDVRPARILGLAGWGRAGSAQASPPTHDLTIVNDDQRAIVRVELADAGISACTLLDLPSPLIGGHEGQATAVVPPGPCLRDPRVIYRDSTTLTVTARNTCRQAVIHIGAARQAGLRQHPPT